MTFAGISADCRPSLRARFQHHCPRLHSARELEQRCSRLKPDSDPMTRATIEDRDARTQLHDTCLLRSDLARHGSAIHTCSSTFHSACSGQRVGGRLIASPAKLEASRTLFTACAFNVSNWTVFIIGCHLKASVCLY
jgi:hypothetical protein